MNKDNKKNNLIGLLKMFKISSCCYKAYKRTVINSFWLHNVR